MNKVLKGAWILAACSVIAKLIGILYRIPLTNIVGAEGIGIYQMIFPFYVLLLTISSGGLPIAISRIVAEKMARGDSRGAKRVMKVSMVSLVLVATVATVILILFRRQIASLQGNPAASLAYLGIAPAIVFVAIIACFRGYYQGKQNMVPSAISQIIEQLLKMGVGIVLAILLLPRGIEYAIFGALLGVTASEIVTALVLFIIYIVGGKRQAKREMVRKKSFELSTDITADVKTAVKRDSIKSTLGQVYKVAIPVTLGSLVMPLTQLIDSVLVINLLSRLGYSTAFATAQFGVLTGPVGTLMNLPAVITLAFSVALLPKIAESITKKEDASPAIASAIKFNIIFALPAAVGLAVFARPILSLLYSRGLSEEELHLATRLLWVASISVIYVAIMQISSTILQGAKKAHIPAINLLVGAGVKILLTLLLVPQIGIMGAIIGTVACFVVSCILNLFFAKRAVSFSVPFTKTILLPFIAAVCFGGAALLLNFLLTPHLNMYLVFLISALISTAIYFIILFATKSLDFSIFKRLRRKKKAV